MINVKLARLKKGDLVAIISPSWGGPSVFPEVFKAGVSVLESLGLKIKIMPFALDSDSKIYKNPKLRAKDIEDAFLDPNVKMIITSIGGDDGIRVLEFINPTIIKNNPKIFMGFSDATVFTTFFNQLGLITFNGPSVMAGFSNLDIIKDEYLYYFKKFFFEKWSSFTCPKFSLTSHANSDWSKGVPVSLINPKKPLDIVTVQGSGSVKGKLFGGCIEVLEFMKGTKFWPDENFWNDKILFFETSEDKPSPNQIKYFLRNYATQGILQKIKGIAFGIAKDYSDKENLELFDVIRKVLLECDLKSLPVIANLQFGHTYPQFILPLGVLAEINLNSKTLTLLESPFL